ncbi:MAG: PTS mannose/fructose/sorbose transporter family subunit IID [Candidatus Latescibacteria bacterium]|nr:PTS mannose/fructose/sorbose transporter family subunit IID [Candidatus Latescibacterota bacterium]
MDAAVFPIRRLDFRDLFNIYLRSYFFQGSFSIKSRQNMGFAFCLEPAGRKLFKNPIDRKAFQLRHTEFFNGNPFMITLVLGAVSHMEERVLDDDGLSLEDISRFKTAVGKATGAVGDRFFWRTLRPFGLVMGLLLSISYDIWGVALFLAIFNIPTMYLRWYWLYKGYMLGPKVVLELKNPNLDRASQTMEIFGGVFLAFLSVAFLSNKEYGFSWISAGTGGIFGLSIILFKLKKSHSVIFVICTGIAFIVSLIVNASLR